MKTQTAARWENGITNGRTFTSELKRFCPISELYQDADDPICSSVACYDDRMSHRLKLRRMWICSECRERFFEQG